MWKRHVEREKVEETTSSSNKKYSTERLVDEQRKLSCVDKIIYQINLKQTEINHKTNLKSISRQTKLIPKQTQIRPV